MIYLIAGISGSGKSTVSRALSKHLNKSFYIEVDSLRELVVSGYASPREWTEETRRQIELGTLNAISLAKNADKYGFDVIIDDTAFIDQEKLYSEMLPDAKRIWICPNIDIILKRNSERGKVIPEKLVRNLYSHLEFRRTSKDWLQVDTSNLSIIESVEKILDLVGVSK